MRALSSVGASAMILAVRALQASSLAAGGPRNMKPNSRGAGCGGSGRGGGGQPPRSPTPTSSGQPTSATNVVVPKWRDAVPAPYLLPTVLHHCDDFVVVNKPYGWASSPAAALSPGSISNPPVVSAWLADTMLANPDSSTLENDGLAKAIGHSGAGMEGVPCLDADCSGAMCFATSPRGQAALDAHGCEAQFVAICEAPPTTRQLLPPGASVDQQGKGNIRGANVRWNLRAFPTRDNDNGGGGDKSSSKKSKKSAVGGDCTFNIRKALAKQQQVGGGGGEATPVRGDGRWQGSGIDRPVLRTLLHCASLTLPSVAAETTPVAASRGKQKVNVVKAPLPSDMAPSSAARATLGAISQKNDLSSIIAKAAALRDDLRASAAAAAVASQGKAEPPRAGIDAASYPTTCFRELHGAADGLPPNFEVDRYGPHLLVLRPSDVSEAFRDTCLDHLQSHWHGPLGSVYEIATVKDRSKANTQPPPQLLRGAPLHSCESITTTSSDDDDCKSGSGGGIAVAEHGVWYNVGLGSTRLSTGLFLDQRPQRAWLAHGHSYRSRSAVTSSQGGGKGGCGGAAGLSVLNLFAHAGGYSVAAAVGGAKRTVSVDLSASWLEHLPRSLALNGLDNPILEATGRPQHDTIYGDCFTWLHKLVKRGEVFDLVILDPPSTSTTGGRKSTRWSAARDYGTLAGLASQLVAPHGALWTTTNCRQLLPRKFASQVKAGLDSASPGKWHLERVAPPAVDFPVLPDHSPEVKNLFWRRSG